MTGEVVIDGFNGLRVKSHDPKDYPMRSRGS
jgi:hypothetical protein